MIIDKAKNNLSEYGTQYPMFQYADIIVKMIIDKAKNNLSGRGGVSHAELFAYLYNHGTQYPQQMIHQALGSGLLYKCQDGTNTLMFGASENKTV